MFLRTTLEYKTSSTNTQTNTKRMAQTALDLSFMPHSIIHIMQKISLEKKYKYTVHYTDTQVTLMH